MDVYPVATPDEMRGAIEVTRTAWRAAYADILPESTFSDPDAPLSSEAVRGRFNDIQSRQETVFLVASKGRERVDGDDHGVSDDDHGVAVYGFAEFVWGDGVEEFVSDDAVQLRAIYVDPDRWGEGVGTDLLAAAEEHLPDTARSLVLETFEENEIGTRFYEARGFEAVDEHTYDVDGESYPTVIYRRSV